MTTRTGNFPTQSSSSATSKNSPTVPLLKKEMMAIENVWTTIFIVVFHGDFIFDIYYSTHTKEKDWQGLLFHFLIAFSKETFGRYVTGDYKLSLWSLSVKSYFSSKKHSFHAVLVSLTRTHLFCYANEINILWAFLCGSFSRIIDYHEFLRNNIIMMQIYSPMRKSGQHYFWKFLTTSLSGDTLPLKGCGSLAFRETEESQAATTTSLII